MANVVPNDWMPPAAMKRIHVHWTAGAHRANATDRKSYHILIENDGKLVRGDRSIAANAPNSGMEPASHTLDANTGAIGVSMCCMHGAREGPFNAGSSPMTRVQWDRMTDVVAELAKRYAVPVTPVTILTHAEVQPNLNIRQRNKWDITRLAFDDAVRGHRAVGDLMRRQVAGKLDAAGDGTGPQPIPDEMMLPRYRVTGVHPSTLNVRDAPNGAKVGALPERAVVERLAVVGNWFHIRTRAGHVGWVFSDFLKAV